MAIPERPNPFETFADTLRLSAASKGWRAFVPLKMILCGLLAGVVAWFIPVNFWIKSGTSEATTVYAASLTFSGIVLALGWGAMSRIYDVLLRGEVSRILVKRDLLSHHLLAVELVHLFLIFSCVANAVALFLTAFSNPMTVNRAVLGVVLMLGLYSINCVWSVMALMTQLSWEDAHLAADKSENVLPIKQNNH